MWNGAEEAGLHWGQAKAGGEDGIAEGLLHCASCEGRWQMLERVDTGQGKLGDAVERAGRGRVTLGSLQGC